jgi:hypothetical protein
MRRWGFGGDGVAGTSAADSESTRTLDVGDIAVGGGGDADRMVITESSRGRVVIAGVIGLVVPVAGAGASSVGAGRDGIASRSEWSALGEGGAPSSV